MNPTGNSATTVWLIRHASTEGAAGRCCGRYDVPLSSQGREQASTMAKRLAGECISYVYSSHLRRAIETARIAVESHHLPVQIMNDLAEIDFGDLDGLTFEEIRERYPDTFKSWMTNPVSTRFPNGESFTQMTTRVSGAMETLLSRHRRQSIAVVTHAGVIRVVLARALSIPDDQIFRLAQDHGAINRIRYFDHGPIVELMNG